MFSLMVHAKRLTLLRRPARRPRPNAENVLSETETEVRLRIRATTPARGAVSEPALGGRPVRKSQANVKSSRSTAGTGAVSIMTAGG